MTARGRVLGFGSAGALVVAGAICAALVGGVTGEVIAIALITVGAGGALLLLFVEVGLSEESERADEEERRREDQARRSGAARRPRLARRPRRPG